MKKWLEKICKKITVITKFDNEEYLVRYSIFSCRWFAVKVHNILSSDDLCMHDHPWAFISILLKGSYNEYRPKDTLVYTSDEIAFKDQVVRNYKTGSVLIRDKNAIHRLEIVEPVWSLVITFKKVKNWGFFTKKGWIPWNKYNSADACK